ncbi:MAG: cupin domain-containing protein [Cyanobacteriota bacterium]|nr:cupin domain-containing protein [Cyanobacteriota bacterium]
MTRSLPTAKTASNVAVTDIGQLSELRQYTFAAPGFPLEVEGKIFLNEILQLTSAEISMNALLSKKSIPFYHKHRLNEEIYIFIRGTGEFQVDDRVFPVGEGTVVRVDPPGERCLRNTSESEELCWIVVQGRAGSQSDRAIADGIGIEKRVSWVGKERLK